VVLVNLHGHVLPVFRSEGLETLEGLDKRGESVVVPKPGLDLLGRVLAAFSDTSVYVFSAALTYC
jgi:hypothetical protein